MAHGYARAQEKPAFHGNLRPRGHQLGYVSQMRSWTVYHWLPSRVRCISSLLEAAFQETDFFEMTSLSLNTVILCSRRGFTQSCERSFLSESGRPRPSCH